MMEIIKLGLQGLQKGFNVFQIANGSEFLPLFFNSEYVCFDNRIYFVTVVPKMKSIAMRKVSVNSKIVLLLQYSRYIL